MDIEEARSTLLDSALHISDSTFDKTKIDRAIRDAGNEWLYVTHSDEATTDIALAASVSSVNITSTVSNFTVSQFVRAEISNRDMALVDYQTVSRRFDGNSPVGQPTMIGFRNDSLAQFDVTTATTHTLNLTYWKQLTSWVLGDAATSTIETSLNIPEEFAGNIIRWGARAYMIYGAPGHADADAAMQKWHGLLALGRERYKPYWPETVEQINLGPALMTQQGR